MSANDSQAATIYDDWDIIKNGAGVCVTCHLTAPWQHSPGVMPKKMHQLLNKIDYSNVTKHEPTKQFLNSPYDTKLNAALVPSNLLPPLPGQKVSTKGVPYKVVARDRIERATSNSGDKNERVFSDGEWTCSF